MKFYINNKELSEKVFWRTLESLVSPMQRVHGWDESEDCRLFMLD